MNYATVKNYDIANGTGVRVSVFVSGCTHRCQGCFNEEAWDFGYGEPFTDEVQEEIIRYLEPDYIKGLSILGGEPFEHSNQQGLLPFLRRVKQLYPTKSIWCYTGYIFEKDILERMCEEWQETREILSYIDILVDGPFIEEQKDWSLKFRGSSNQRIIDVPKSLSAQETVIAKIG